MDDKVAYEGEAREQKQDKRQGERRTEDKRQKTRLVVVGSASGLARVRESERRTAGRVGKEGGGNCRRGLAVFFFCNAMQSSRREGKGGVVRLSWRVLLLCRLEDLLQSLLDLADACLFRRWSPSNQRSCFAQGLGWSDSLSLCRTVA